MIHRFLFPVLFSVALLPTAGWCVFGKATPGLFLEPAGALPAAAVGDARPVEKNPPVVLGADEVGYDQENGIVVARGGVEVEQGAYVLMADQVTYFQNRDTVIAEGNVSLLQPSGDVVFSDRAELNDALKVGVITAFKARLSDNSVLVASRAVRTSPSSTTLTNVEYTPCNLCAGRSPFWQLNANEVKLDQIHERVTYDDATLNIRGVPIFYTPFLSHPTPDAPAESGFLPPQYGTNNNIGTFVKAPYYWHIDHDKELIVTPWYTTGQGLVVQGDYQQLTDGGNYMVNGSATYPEQINPAGTAISGNQFRGHIFARGEESLGDYSRLGFDIQRASDDTYLRRYGIGDQRTLFSRVFAESAQNRNFLLAQGIAIQGLRVADSAKTTPLVLPTLQGYYETAPDANGIRYHVAGDAQVLTRDIGVDQQRLSLTAGAALPYVTDGGHILTTTLNLRQDIYQSDNVPINGGLNTVSETTYRALPQAAVEWRYPLINHLENDTLTLEPLALAVVQADGGNSVDISNEDSRLLELTDTNLFSITRMPGLDAVDSGMRLAYGARGQYLFQQGTSIDALLGQNYNPNGKTPFPNSTTPGEDFSDYIGRVAFNVSPVTFAYRFAVDKGRLSLNRNEVSLLFAKPWLTFMTSYRSLNNNRYVANSEEVDANVTLPLSDNWSIYGGARRNLSLDQFVSASSGIVFKNECFNIGFDAVRLYTRDRDVEPTTQFLLRVAFRNLGEFGGN
jgi:LPS-assembly protein